MPGRPLTSARGARLSRTGALSPVQQDRLFQVTSVLRGYNLGMDGESLVFMNILEQQGLTLTAQQKAEIVNDARRKFGKCVTEPSPGRLDMKSQLPTTNEAVIGRR